MTTLRRLAWMTCTVAATWALAGSIAAAAQTPPITPDAADRRPDEVAFRIDAQPIEGALREFASQANLQLVYETAEVSPNIRSSHVAGAFTPEAALSRLLTHTNLEYKFINDRTVSIRSADGAPRSRAHLEMESVSGDAQPRFARSESADLPEGSSEQPVAADMTTEHDVHYGARRKELEEVIVTAQKRTERLQDVPVPVTAIRADALVDSNQLRLQDYYTQVPGLTVMPDDFNGVARLTIRGLTTGGFTNPTVGVVIDDVPYGSSTNLGAGYAAPDIDPSDLVSVEVLRGPQGALYGASSIGGLLKFVTVDPSTDGVSGRLEAGTSSIHNGAQLGYNVRGSVNVPITDTLAVRASGFTRQDAGYIDDPGLNERGVNEGKFDGGRLSALWRPSEDLSLKLGALVQHATTNGAPFVDLQAGLGDLQQSGALRGAGGFTRKDQEYSAILKARLGSIDLTSLSGYGINTYSTLYDETWAFSDLTQGQFGVPGTLAPIEYKTSKFTQEVRLSAPIGKTLEWLFGAFFTHENSPGVSSILAVDPGTGALAGEWDQNNTQVTFSEYAAFADLTYHVTDRFDVQIGGRESQNRQTFSSTVTGPLYPVLYLIPSPVVQPEVASKDNSFTYLITPRLKVSSALMVYARLASGYRVGGLQGICTVPVLQTRCEFGPDTTQNYEIGVKGNSPDRTLSFDASLYRINWKNIQILLIDPTTHNGYTANEGRAKSQGAELSIESRPVKGLTVAAWVAWNDAALTKAFPITSSAYGVAGDRLPYSSRFSGNLSLDETFSVTSTATGFVGASVSYVGAREGEFTGTAQRQYIPAYAQTDMRAGVRYDSWTVNLFVNNVADKRGLLAGGLGTLNPSNFNYIQPRTAGVSVAKSF